MSACDSTTQTIYRFIPGFPSYAVGDDGSVWSRRLMGRAREGFRSSWRRIKGMWAGSKRQYHYATLWDDNRNRSIAVHILVLEAFVGPCPPGMECRHLDGNPANNRLDNLCWGTKLENAQDRIRHGTSGVGSTNSCAKLTEEDIPVIRRLRAEGVSCKEVGRRFGVSVMLISMIVRRKSWTHVPEEMIE